jgi:D-glycero-alpha-D-manno-heptose-7-phosphate kinase
MEFRPDGSVEVNPLRMSSETLAQLESNLVMFFTGYSRDADLILGNRNQSPRTTISR